MLMDKIEVSRFVFEKMAFKLKAIVLKSDKSVMTMLCHYHNNETLYDLLVYKTKCCL